jgi:thiaminase/transcriptional activator TenA
MRYRFSEHLHKLGKPIWDAQFSHPFIQGIGSGDLDVDRFKHWVRQDYLFLIDYTRLFAIAVARCPDLEGMTRYANLAQTTITHEMQLHLSYAKEFGISPSELEQETKSPTCQGYTDFLLRTASLGSYAEFIGALLPCMWGFHELATRLLTNGLPHDTRYAKWIEMYSDPEFGELAEWCKGLTDTSTEGLPKRELELVEKAFLTSSRYEYLFWDMAWKQETWPLLPN